jgi:hypothetical protein
MKPLPNSHISYMFCDATIEQSWVKIHAFEQKLTDLNNDLLRNQNHKGILVRMWIDMRLLMGFSFSIDNKLRLEVGIIPIRIKRRCR